MRGSCQGSEAYGQEEEGHPMMEDYSQRHSHGEYGTGEEILSYILVQVPPPTPSAPRPRFSLYLSAQLQYGVVRVYSRQCHYLIEEIHPIDIPQVLPIPELPSPTDIPQIRHILEAPTPPERPPPSPRRRRVEVPPITVVSPEIITMKEVEPIMLLEIEGERELPEITAREIDLLAEQEDFVLPLAPPRRPPMEELEEEMRAREAEITARLSPPTRVEPPKGARAAAPSPTPSCDSQRVERPQSAPKLELAVYEPAPPRAPRRPRRFLDEVSQIPRDQFNKQMPGCAGPVPAPCDGGGASQGSGGPQRSMLKSPRMAGCPPSCTPCGSAAPSCKPVDYAALRARRREKKSQSSELEVAREALEPSIL
nr:meiotic recombination protein REC8 homolog [Chelonoidis abingdonii]